MERAFKRAASDGALIRQLIVVNDVETKIAQLIAGESSLVRCPFATYARLGEIAPAVWVPRIRSWVITHYDHVVSILRDTQTFSSCGAATTPPEADPRFMEIARRAAVEGGDLAEYVELITGGRRQPLLSSDDPDHRRIRRSILKPLAPARIGLMAPFIRAVLKSIVGPLPTQGEIEFVSSFATVLPREVIGELLGISLHERPRFREIAQTANAHSVGPDEAIAIVRAERDVRTYFSKQLNGDRRSNDTLIGVLQQAVEDERITLDEATGICREIVVAGNDSTANILGLIVSKLAGDPAIFADLREGALDIERFIEEMIRLETPFNGFYRKAMQAVTIGGVAVPKGATLLLVYQAANRDPSVFSKPDTIHFAPKSDPPHIGFGMGEHFCVGAALARLELKLALQCIGASFAHLAVVDGDDALSYIPSWRMRGLTQLRLNYVKLPSQ